MQVVRWGNSLAIRLHAEFVRRLGLKQGDDIDPHLAETESAVARYRRPEEVLASLRRFRGRLPADRRLGRDEAHER